MPIMGLQTGTRLGTTKAPLIDPSNLKIVAYEIEGPRIVERPSYLRIADVRELGRLGMIIDSNDEFVGKDDVVAIKKIIDLNFNLIRLTVIDETKHKLGKVGDFVVDTDSFFIQQITVKRGFIKSFAETEILIHRNQIIEINDSAIIVKSGLDKKAVTAKPTSQLTFMNPFRQSAPQTEAQKA